MSRTNVYRRLLLLTIVLALTSCVRSDSPIVDFTIPTSCVGLVDRLDAPRAPEAFPVQLSAGALTDYELETLHEAAALWSSTISENLFEISLGTEKACDTVRVSADATIAQQGHVGLTTFGRCRDNEITFVSGHPQLLLILIHELGHILGLDHEAEPESVLYYQVMAGQSISARSICEARLSYALSR